MLQYHNGEEITKDRIQDEPWYSDYQLVCEIMCVGPNPDKQDFYEKQPNGKELALEACKKDFKDSPGPIHKGWKPPSNKRLKRWIDSCWLTEEQIQKIEEIRKEEMAK